MSKVICDLCGTVYQDTAESCPICGYSQVLCENDLEEILLEDTGRLKGGRFVQSNKYWDESDYDEEDYDEYDDDEDEDEDEEDYTPASRSNAAIVVILVVVIMLLLTAIGYVFLRYFLPNKNTEEASGKPGLSLLETEPTGTEATTEPTIPCDSIALTGGMAELSREGQYWLLHVKVTPEDTTDDLLFISEDESIATVTEDGRITAVSEGETTIYITCGQQRINCPVIIKFTDETQPRENEGESITTGESDGATEGTSAPELLDVELKLVKYDISVPVGYGVTLHLDCPLEPTDLEWTVEHPHIASVDENGFVKALGYGTTAVIVRYGEQEVTCIVRCK